MEKVNSFYQFIILEELIKIFCFSFNILTFFNSSDDTLDMWVKANRDISGKTSQLTGLTFKNGWCKNNKRIVGPGNLVSEEESCRRLVEWLKKRKNPIIVSYQKNCHDSNSLFRIMKANDLTSEFTNSVKGFINVSKLLKTEIKFFDSPDVFRAKIAQLKDFETVKKCSYSIDFLKEFFEYSRQCRVKWCSMSHFFKEESFMDYAHSLRFAHAGFDYKMMREIFDFGGLDGLMLLKKVANRNDFCGNFVIKPKQVSNNVIKSMFGHFQLITEKENNLRFQEYIETLKPTQNKVLIKKQISNNRPKPCANKISLPSGRLPTSLLFKC